jgi:hypothetical protein
MIWITRSRRAWVFGIGMLLVFGGTPLRGGALAPFSEEAAIRGV